MSPQDFLEAARVPHSLLPQEFGLWNIIRVREDSQELFDFGWPSITMLTQFTAATLHRRYGDIVMEDSRRELSRHLPIWLAAKGSVLITGLGLGCVVRGLLANPDIDLIDVVEIDRGILERIGPEFEANPRVKLHLGNALKVEWSPGTRWDFAWHDIWTEEPGELPMLHGLLVKKYLDMVNKKQGAWMFPRQVRRKIPDTFLLHGNRKLMRSKQ